MNNRIIIYTALFFLTIGYVSGQNVDSLTFVQKTWKTEKIKRGLVWKQAHFDNLFSSRQAINIVEVDLRKFKKRIKLAGLPDSLILTSQFAERADALAAINGGFFNMKDGGAVDFIKIDGHIVNTSTSTNRRVSGIFAFDKGKFAISPAADSTRIYGNYANVLLSGPLLLENKNIVPLDSNAFNNNRHPRSAIAIQGHRLLLITVDGRNREAQGMSLPELCAICKWYGAQEAMNLDGGGSTALYIKGKSPNGIVNHPSDNKLFDHEGERKVANTILIL